MTSLFKVPDPTDWHPTPLHGLGRIEASLRCQVCKDFFNTPMITSCSHTFCSLCIRRCLSQDGKCPSCRTGEQEIRLRRNWAVQEIADSFKAGREGMLRVARQATTSENGNGMASTKRKVDDMKGNEVAEPSNSQRTGSKSQKVTTSEKAPIVVEDHEKDGDSHLDDGLVACPLCSRRMKELHVFPHLNSCPGNELQTAPMLPSPSAMQNREISKPSNPSPPPTRLPTVYYDLLNEKALKRKLSNLGVPAWGPKPLLIRRHTEFLNLHNANCDSPNPKSKREILQDLHTWEITQGGYAQARGLNNEISRKDFDTQAWSKENDDTFQDLVAKARQTHKSAPRNTQGTIEPVNDAEV